MTSSQRKLTPFVFLKYQLVKKKKKKNHAGRREYGKEHASSRVHEKHMGKRGMDDDDQKDKTVGIYQRKVGLGRNTVGVY